MAQGLCELLWLKIILDDLKINLEGPMTLNLISKSDSTIAVVIAT